MPEPKRPSQLSEYAAKTLQALAAEGLGHTISLGGALGLHYLDYRDFRDIYTLCDRGLTFARECWALWGERQRRAGSDADRNRARLAVQTHLARIAQHRPLETIMDAGQREEASRVRAWFEKDFLNALLD